MIGAFSGFMVGSKLIPLEGRAFWAVLIAPSNKTKYLVGKFLTTIVLTATIASCAIFIIQFKYNSSLSILLTAWIATISILVGVSALAQWVGAAFARFDWEHPKRMLTNTGQFVSLLIFAIYMFLLTAGAVVLYYLFPPVESTDTIEFIVIFVIIFAGITSIISLLFASDRLQKIEWKF